MEAVWLVPRPLSRSSPMAAQARRFYTAALAQVALRTLFLGIQNGNFIKIRWHAADRCRYDPVQKYGAQDCIASINNIVDKMDAVIETNNTGAIDQLKTLFGLQDLEDIRDFVYSVALPIGGPMNYPLGTYQELNWNSSYEDPHVCCSCYASPAGPS
jgi:hypothetical protein